MLHRRHEPHRSSCSSGERWTCLSLFVPWFWLPLALAMISNFKEPKDGIYSVVRCIQLFIRIFGFWPFYIGNNPIGRAKRIFMKILEAFWHLWSVVLIISCVYSIYFLSKSAEKAVSDKTVTQLGVINRFVLMLVLSLSIAIDMWNRNRVRKMITIFYEFDSEVRSLYVDLPHTFKSTK